MEFITNRTKKDYYGYSDLNRVENAVAELAIIAKGLGVKKQFETKTDWGVPGLFSASEWPAKQQMQRYLNNVYELCSAVEAATYLPSSMEKLTWDGANRIEEALSLAFARIEKIIQALRYSGEIYAETEVHL